MTTITPRLLPLPDAAAYVGAKSPQAFYRQWKRGKWPDPARRDMRPFVWDRCDLDKCVSNGNYTIHTDLEWELG